MTSTASYEVINNIALITCQQPPVNQLSFPLRKGIYSHITDANNDKNIKSIIIICNGKTFIAGADIREFATGEGNKFPTIHDIIPLIENSSKPVISAIHGTALGGGFEVALSCHYRIGTSKCKVGLPEVAIGILPGAGGTQRLPRLVGPLIAAEMICSGKHISANIAKKYGILDKVISIPKNYNLLMERNLLRTYAIEFACIICNNKDINSRIISKRTCPKMDNIFYEQISAKYAKQKRGMLSPQLCLKAIRAAQDSINFDIGIKKEREYINILKKNPQSKALQHFFFSQRQSVKIPIINKLLSPINIKKVGIIGAGTMGGGILMCFIEANIPVIILDMKQEYLDKGFKTVERNWMRQVKKGKLSHKKYEKYISSEMLSLTLNYNDLSDVDIVIEAVFEDLEIKKKVFRKLDVVCKPECILASNTSYIPIEKIASVTNRLNKCIGCHFFAPANKMRLLENVRFKGGSNDITCLTVQKMAQIIGKIGVLVQSCHGFVGNRMYARESMEVTQLLLEGATVEQIDSVCRDNIGCKMGLLQVKDLSGLDIGYEARQKGVQDANLLGDKYLITDLLIRKYNRRGLKNGKGFYDYPNLESGDRRPVKSKIVETEIINLSKEKGIKRRKILAEEIIERMYYPFINEGFNILNEGIVIRPSDIDIVHIFGYGFPSFRGGPMFWAQNEIGLKKIYNTLLKYYSLTNKEHFKPSDLLKMCVENNMSLNQYWTKIKKKNKSKL